MDNTVKLKDLVAGDVLLYKGVGFVSRAIQFFDGTDFSHAALYLGEGMVGEAIATGLERQTVEKGAHGIWVQAHRLKERVPTMYPVLSTANRYLDQGNRYGYEQLLLLAFLCLTRKLRFTPSLRYMVRTVLDAAGAALTHLVSTNRQPMIRSEFVFRAFDEAVPEPEDAYKLSINRPPDLIESGIGTGVNLELAGAGGASGLKGQGVHPQSLLAFHTSPAGNAWLNPPVETPFEVVVQPEVELAQLESMVDGYLAEVQADAPEALSSYALPEATLDDLQGSINRFAANLYTAAHPDMEELPAFGAPSATKMMDAYLMQTAADFVTPGDLYKTQSLFQLGKLDI